LKCLLLLSILTCLTKTYGQCFVDENVLGPATAYTPKEVLLYSLKNKNFDASATVEKMVINNNNQKSISYSFIFSVTGHVSYILIPDVAEITTINGDKIFLYIPKRSGQGVVCNYATTECYGNFKEESSKVTQLMTEPITEIILKNNKDAIKIKPPSDLFISMFNCLKSKN